MESPSKTTRTVESTAPYMVGALMYIHPPTYTVWQHILWLFVSRKKSTTTECLRITKIIDSSTVEVENYG